MERPEKILVIEDDRATLKSIVSILDRHDFKSLTALNVDQAIKHLNSDSQIGLIITDLSMPGKDGFYLIDYVKSNYRFHHIPVVVCSHLGERDAVLKALRLGATDYLVKPVHPEKILQTINNVIKRGRGRILVVDDEQIIRELLERLLQRENFTTFIAKSGEEAIEILKETMVDLVITDIAMPGMNGLELMVHVKDIYPFVPVLVITGFSGKYNSESVIAEGADGYIAKPFKNIEIINKVKSYL